jgi:hypothetical protein
MATTTTGRPAKPAGRDGFGQLLLAEWTKLRSVPRWTMAVIAAVVLTVLVSLLGAAGSSDVVGGERQTSPTGPDGRPATDQFQFVHQPLSGDGSVTARVRAQAGIDGESHEWARAGVMVKQSTEPGSAYAAMMVTPGHGVRFQSNFTNDRAGSAATVPRWLRLTRSGTSITGAESADGGTWSQVGTVNLRGLPPTVEVGLFVTSPAAHRSERQYGSAGYGTSATVSTATFDSLRVEAARPGPPARWTYRDVGQPDTGDVTEAGGTFTVTGTGDIAPEPPSDDIVRLSLSGAFVGLMAIAALGVLYITSEYKRGMIRTTFAVSPRRGRVLAAKAIVIGLTTFAAGLVASVAAFLLAKPILRSNGFAPPAYPDPSLSDGPVLRAVVGTAAILALIAVLSLAAGAVLRRSAGAITAVIVLLVLPQLIAGALPLSLAQWLMRLTPAAGFAIQQTTERYAYVFDLCLPESGCFPEGPWPGFAVLCAYAAVTLAVAFWLLRRRDT